jgi:hypothetical protein
MSSTLSYPCASATETLSLPVLSERVRAAYADLARQSSRLDALTVAFEKQKLTVSPTAYAAMALQQEQQRLITENARRVAEEAERTFAIAQHEENQQRLTAGRKQRRVAVGQMLEQKTLEINQLQAQLSLLPEKLAQARQESARLQQEWGELA